MNVTTRAYLEIHFAVFLYGFAAILGALISVSALSMVWWRLFLCVVILLCYLPFYTEVKKLLKKEILIFLGIGGVIAFHWVCFYGSIKLANASVALITFSATPFFTSIIEPLITKSKWRKIDFIFGILVIPAMSLILLSIDFSMLVGAVAGIMASLLAAVFSTLNKKYIDRISPITLFIIEMIGALLTLSPIIPFVYWGNMEAFMPRGDDWMYLLCLVIFMTILAFILNLRALKHISAFTTNFIISLEPVYGIALAIMILNEHRDLNTQFYIGVAVILTLVFAYPIVANRFTKMSTDQGGELQ